VIRVVALLVAVGLVTAGYLVRERAAAADDPVLGAATPAATTIRCDAELETACRALRSAGHDVTVEPAGVSFESLSRAEAADAPDLWVTVAPWPTMVDDARTRAGLGPLFTSPAELVATSPLVVAIWDDRADVLEATCADAGPSLGCVTAAAGQRWTDLGGPESWGPFKLGLSDPTTSSIGLAALAVATADELDTMDFGTRSLTDGAFLDWLGAVAGAVPDFDPPAGSALATMLQVGPAAFDVALTTEAAAEAARDGGAQRAAMLRVAPAPSSASVDVVVASRGVGAHEAILDEVAGSLGDHGWVTASTGAGSATGLDGPPGASLPGAGAHTALRATFDQIIR
jgi:hypothetical protein